MYYSEDSLYFRFVMSRANLLFAFSFNYEKYMQKVRKVILCLFVFSVIKII